MLLWTEKEPEIYNGDSSGFKNFKSIIEELNKDITESNKKITVREFYEQYLGIDISNPYLCTTDNEGEFFIDPDEWGWDKNGFRRLYRTVTIRQEL